MFTLGQKAVVTFIVLGMNLLVLLFMPWFVIFTAIPSAGLLWIVLTR